ncbi:MAG: TonB C-terminal domain-containing protein [Nitrospiraceae bacterium]|nr:MAG: TonB C-terminal domain-containing protein [Nitrospiraceae bacterium]
MTAGIPDEMRRTALVSLAAHVVVLALLSVVSFVKMPPMGASSIQVMLVSKGASSPVRPPQVESQPQPKPVEEASAPIPPPAPPPVKERRVEVLEKRVKEVAVPKPVAPVQKAPVAAHPVVKQEPVVLKNDTPQDLNETLRRAEEALMKLPSAAASKPAAPAKPRTSDEINKLLGQLPPASPAPVVALAPQAAPRTAALERCPPQARVYCPLLEAAINRVWNADTDPGVRSVLESAGDSTATIRMVILPDGVIKEIQLSKSSGNDAYDRAVQSVLRELRHLPPLPAEMKGEPFVAVTSFTYSRKRDS